MTIIHTAYRDSGLKPAVILRLLSGDHTPADRRAYYRTEHYSKLKAALIEATGEHCQLCRRKSGLAVHHNTYDRMFCERVEEDVLLICKRCHKRISLGRK